ncbi:hypothetical protein VTO42DRAFT_186 [Malbranchea cinnamomea]
MKASHILLAVCIGAVHAADLFQISVKTDKWNSVGLIAELDELERTHRAARTGIGASVSQKGVICQAYSDPHGRDKLGRVFSAGNDAEFTENDDDQPVSIGAFLCARSKEELIPPALRPTEDGDRGNGGNDDDDYEKSVKLQFRTGFSSFSRGVVPVGKVYKLENSDLGDSVLEAFVVSVKGAALTDAECQLYKDSNGQKALGEPFSIYPLTLDTKPVTARSVKCEIRK